jgi:hypothetical protein
MDSRELYFDRTNQQSRLVTKDSSKSYKIGRGASVKINPVISENY